ncbi:hypothetical protein CHS0354_038602 [Potamilus streckersoni]|uniref:G-protein coupled receptors family 1 profile domain-containing protein n=1 Tax=Potamilus streckersoni TaxID=2493646 RepID=A0AAE0WDI6_9BIVA|nr:hypothetical protein CHS0354_038602 [Potamilus streckersoni]
MDLNLTSQHAANETLEELNLRYAKALVPVTIFLGFLAVTGVIGNILVLFVFSRSKEYRKDKFRIFVIIHGVIDLVECVSLIPAEIFKHQQYFAFENTAACKAKCFFNVFASGAASFMLILINIDRFRRICQPFKNQVGYGLAIKLSSGMCFISILLALPSVALCGIQENLMMNIQGGLTKVYVCSYEEIYKNNGWREAYKIVLLTLTFIMLVLCTIVYILIGREVVMSFRRNCSTHFMRLNSAIPDEGAPEPFVQSDGCDKREKVTEVSFKNEESNKLTDVMKHDCLSTPVINVALDSRIAQISKRLPSNYPISSYRKTLIWFILTVIFVVSHILYSVLALKRDAIFKMRPNEFAVYSFFFRIYFVNSMANPIVYACLFKRFRTVCRDYLIASVNYIFTSLCRQSNEI